MFNLLRLFLVLTVCLSWQMVMGAPAPKVSVASSNTPEYTKGQVLTENTKIDLKKGDELTLVASFGKITEQRTFKGPYSDSKIVGLIKTIKEIIKPKRTGHKKSGKDVNSQTRERMMKNPNLLIATEDKHFCYNAKKPLKFWRPISQQKEVKVVITEKGARKKELRREIWKAETNTLGLSLGNLLKEDTSYFVDFKETSYLTRLYKMPSNFDSDTYKWMWMANKKCKRQADILISKKRVASQ